MAQDFAFISYYFAHNYVILETRDTEQICEISAVEGYNKWGEQVQYPRKRALMSQCEIEEEKEPFEGEGEEVE
ncbi:hypothetical protein BKA82DRAFT_28903 [Pisolithus tinctorius]|uniref:Uncharacterized protein n=1 Tax=Pisolithus tinctorius Marx 270 TaxID=870435 RepID=A0A0C3IWG9_PISTI|nr:hypothetical protein BKA82DRAFT_28903 [Pisolithus tinctorius]KIO01178.1 hypothetical protein M404DRAFT_28903 [Pisolithus tinctorius Marx 270]